MNLKYTIGLYDKLKKEKKKLEFNNKYTGIPIYTYTYTNNQISTEFNKYDSISSLKNLIYLDILSKDT